MSDDDPKDGKAGYGHPPRHSQFPPGKSGNPSGRPKKRPSLQSDLQDELSAPITVQEGNASVITSKQRAVVKALVKAAVEGNLRAVTALLDFCAKVQDDDSDIPLEEVEILENYRNNKSSPRED